MAAEVPATSNLLKPLCSGSSPWTFYFRLLVAATLAVSVASFIRDRDQLFTNISFWPFLICFVFSIWRKQAGFLVTLFLLTITPSLHEQLNALTGTALHAWAYPGVDCCLGFLAAWVLKRGLDQTAEILSKNPSGKLLLFHAWMVLSAVIAVSRNLWQSASEFSLRGLAFNAWLARGISWHDDYYPLQDPFFYGVAVAMLFSTWTLLNQYGPTLLRRLVWAVVAGAATNVCFVFWQKATGLGWVNGQLATSANAFWPDLHSFGVFMAVSLFLSLGIFRQSRTGSERSAAGLAVIVSVAGLYLSGSRSTVLFVAAFLVGWAAWVALKQQGWRRAIPLVAAITVLAAVHWTLNHGYRGLSYSTLSEHLTQVSPASLNLALSHRPEIWAAAIRMYSAFPLFGLGQGAFYRLSVVPEFSGSDMLIWLGGDGVHNEFLRMLVELGPVGVGLFLLVVIPFVRLGRQNLRWVSSYALAGIALGSVYTNAILVRELLLLAGVFAGSYFWEAQTATPEAQWQKATIRIATATLAALAAASLIEVFLSFNHFPFTYGQRCFEVRPLAKDGWTQGVVRVPIPPRAARVDVTVSAERPDLTRRPLGMDLSVLVGSVPSSTTERHTFTERAPGPTSVQLVIPDSLEGSRELEVKPLHCFVPLNLGITYDPRRLGVRVKEMQFFTSAGVETH